MSSSLAADTPEHWPPITCGSRPDLNITDITLVNPRPVFVERIRLHQLVADSGTATVDYDTLLGDGIRLVVDGADRIDTAERQVLLTSGAALDYDYLIYAVGSTGAVPAVPRRSRIRLFHRRSGKRATAAPCPRSTCPRTLPSRWWAAA